MIERNKVYCGNSIDLIDTLKPNSVDTIITSPPYYQLRDYKMENQIGQENSINDYVNNLVLLFKCYVSRVISRTNDRSSN